MNIYQLDYYERFVCISNRCEDICCKNYTIPIDRDTYYKYKDIKDIAFRAKLLLYTIKMDVSENSYAKFRLKNNKCRFLTKDNLCSVQKQYGEDYLCKTCFQYPRIYNNVYGSIERSLQLSCIEACKIILLNSQKINFVCVDEDISRELYISKYREYIENRYDIEYNYINEIRGVCIDILQNRNYSFEKRLLILSKYCSRLQDGLLDDRLILEHDSDINISDIHYLEYMLLNDKYIDGILVENVKNKKEYKKYKNYIVYSEYLGDINIQNYEDIKHIYYGYFCNKEYIYENFFVNYIFKYIFPLRSYKSIREEYIILLFHYTIIKMYLIAITGINSELNDGMVVDFIHKYSKSIEHDIDYEEEIFKII